MAGRAVAFYNSRKGNSGGKRTGGSPFIVEFIYKQADGTPYLKVCKTADKQFPQFHLEGTKWVKGKPKGPKIPYRSDTACPQPVCR